MRIFNVVVVVLSLASFAGVEAVDAQTEKALREKGEQGQTVRPYISHTEFQDISVGGRIASGKSVSDTAHKSLRSKVKFSNILTVGSLDEVISHFGEPTSTEYTKFPGVDYIEYEVVLTYDGVKLWYKKVDKNVKLQTMAIISANRFLEIGGIRLRPGMSTDSLSATTRQAIEDGVSVLRVVESGGTEKGPLEESIRESRTKISIILNEDGKSLKEIVFNRIVI